MNNDNVNFYNGNLYNGNDNVNFYNGNSYSIIYNTNIISNINYQEGNSNCFESLIEYNYNNKEEHECGICLEKILIGDKVVRLPCSHTHIFHSSSTNCQGIKKWLEDHDTCPICRFKLT